MNNTLPAQYFDKASESGTEFKKSLSIRGSLLMKEMRDIGKVECKYGKIISVGTAILTILDSRIKSKSYSIRLEQIDKNDETEGSAFLDFDEIEEFLKALLYIDNVARKIANQDRDYTELIYSTKDNIQFGFFHNERNQQPFIRISAGIELAFLSFEALRTFRQQVEISRDHLVQQGAKVESGA
ncbi:MAG: hypothetical protein IT324_27575 [Anaerolineae bacterium]|nr:hypothetical protein [Anaerolineae bacterium]